MLVFCVLYVFCIAVSETSWTLVRSSFTECVCQIVCDLKTPPTRRPSVYLGCCATEKKYTYKCTRCNEVMSSKLLRNIHYHRFFQVDFSRSLLDLEFLWKLFWISKIKTKVLKTNIIDMGVECALFFVKYSVCVRYEIIIFCCSFM